MESLLSQSYREPASPYLDLTSNFYSLSNHIQLTENYGKSVLSLGDFDDGRRLRDTDFQDPHAIALNNRLVENQRIQRPVIRGDPSLMKAISSMNNFVPYKSIVVDADKIAGPTRVLPGDTARISYQQAKPPRQPVPWAGPEMSGRFQKTTIDSPFRLDPVPTSEVTLDRWTNPTGDSTKALLASFILASLLVFPLMD
jgi:hypothetical protein